ncbi:hypothetical protein CPC16_007237 [Podila verticillata]|nr:hypothetical protein CPC16_007237 [Podila verticillata]
MKDRLRLALRSLIPSRKSGQASIQEARNTTQEFLPIKIDSGPGLIGLPFYTFNDRQLIICSAEINPGYDLNDNSFTDGIRFLDLAVAWSASAPAWTKLTRPRLEVISTIGGVILNKEGSIMYHFNVQQKVQAYNVRTAEWSSPVSVAEASGCLRWTVFDSDRDQVFGVTHCCVANSQAYTRNLTAYDPTTNNVVIVSKDIPGHAGRGPRVYSSARKSLFFLWTGGPTVLYEYNIADDSWSTVVRRTQDVILMKKTIDWEDIPYPEVRINLVLSDVYIFDIETSIWTMETTTPVGYSSAACAVSGDHLILYGGMSVVYNPHPDQYGSDFVANGTPSIYNMKTRTWVSVYTPS